MVVVVVVLNDPIRTLIQLETIGVKFEGQCHIQTSLSQKRKLLKLSVLSNLTASDV